MEIGWTTAMMIDYSLQSVTLLSLNNVSMLKGTSTVSTSSKSILGATC